jgi:hypothetical protein
MKQWQGLRYQRQEHGDLDLDQNGVPHWRDAGEIAATRRAFFDLVRELRAALPPETLLIANGLLALTDTAFAKQLDGIAVETWPELLTGWKGLNYTRALDPANPIGVPALTARGRYRREPGFVLLEAIYDQDERANLAPFAGAVAVKRATTGLPNPKPFTN